MKQEFNLSEKREQLFLNLCNAEPDVAWIIQVIENEIKLQDMEFLEILKKEFRNEDNSLTCYEDVDSIIDKIAGDKSR